MLKITPTVTACRLTIQLRPAAEGSEADITYTHTSLGPKGDEFIASFTEAFYRAFMQEWESQVNLLPATRLGAASDKARLKAGTTRNKARLKAGTTRNKARLKAGTTPRQAIARHAAGTR